MNSLNDLPNPVSFNEALEKFLTHLRSQKRSSATTIAYSGDIEQLRIHLEDKRITQVTTVQTEHLQVFVEQLGSKNYTAKSVSRKINSLKTFFKFLHLENLISHNPAHPLTHPKYDTKPPRILTNEEVTRLRETVRLDIRISAIIEVLLQTGLRISELANLRVDDIRKNELYIRSIENNSERTVPLTRSGHAAITNYLSMRPKVEDNHIFITKTGHPLLVRNIRTSIDRYFRLAGIQNAKVNDLRHTFIARQIEAGVEPEAINKVVGHRRLSSTQKYLDHVKPLVATTTSKIVEV